MTEQREIPRLTQATKRLRELKDRKEQLEAELKEVNKECKNIQERIIPKIMEDAEMDKYRIQGVGTIYVKQELYVSLAKADGEDPDEVEPPFYDWAREHAPDLIRPFIHPARLKAYAKDRLENGMALPDNMIKASFVPTATLLRR